MPILCFANLAAGMLGFFGMVGYGVREFKNRGQMTASTYFMHLRVKAQSIVVGAMTLAVGYHLLKRVYEKREKAPPPKIAADQ